MTNHNQQGSEKKEMFLRRAISLGELIGFAIVIFSSGIMFYTSTQVRMNALEIRMDQAEGLSREIKDALLRIENRQSQARDELNNIRIEINNKKDR